jgi:hypothetical protein
MGVHKDENEWSRKQTTAIVPNGVDHLDNLAISDGFVAYSYAKEGQFFINIMHNGRLYSQSYPSYPYAEKITSLAWSTERIAGQDKILKVGFSKDAFSPRRITSVLYVNYMQKIIREEKIERVFSKSTDHYKLQMSGVNTMEKMKDCGQRINLWWVADDTDNDIYTDPGDDRYPGVLHTPHCVMDDQFERVVQLDAWQLVKNAGFKPEHEEYENISSNKMCMSTDDSTQQIYFSAGLQIYRFGYDVVVNKWNTPYRT